MKIALLGNLCNTAYNFAKMLRRKGVEADVFISTREQATLVGAPEWEDPEISAHRPPWIHSYRDRNPYSMLRLLGELWKYDLVHAFASSISFCHLAGIPVIAHALGADLKEVAHERGLRGRFMRRGFKTAQRVLFSDLDHLPHIRAFKFDNALYLSAAVDTDKYSPGSAGVIEPEISRDKLVLFHSSFLFWRDGGMTSKRNDRFFRAYAQFVNERSDVFLVIVEAGPDAPRARAMMRNLGLKEHVRFVPPMDKARMLAYYRCCDVIVDQFGMPKLGVNALEGMSCGRPVMVNLDRETVGGCYGEFPPVYACSSEEEILSQLRSMGDRASLRERGEGCREWILKYHHWEKITERLIDLYSESMAA